MRKLICFFSMAICGWACTDKVDVCDLDRVPKEHLVLQKCEIDTVLFAPQGINAFHDKLIIMEPQKKSSMLSVFSRDSLLYLYSGLDRGHARNEVLSLRRDYFAFTDTSFFVLSRNVEKEYVLKDSIIEYVGSTYITIPDALNEVLHLGKGKYVTAGFTNGEGNERLLFEDGDYRGFGDYPGTDLKDGENFFFNGSKSAGMMGKDKIWNFYKSHRLVRSYDLQGNLLQEIEIRDSRKKNGLNAGDRDLCFYKIRWNLNYIAVLYNEEYSWNEFHKMNKDDRKRELQLWTWDGELKRRIYFDVPYDIYTLSEDNIFYAMNMDKPDVIYTYDLNEE